MALPSTFLEVSPRPPNPGPDFQSPSTTCSQPSCSQQAEALICSTSVLSPTCVQGLKSLSAPLLCLPMGRTEQSPQVPQAMGSGSPAGSLAFGNMFQHLAGVTAGCYALRMGKGLFPSNPAPGKTGPAQPQPATCSQDQGHRLYLIWPQGPYQQPPFPTTDICITGQM